MNDQRHEPIIPDEDDGEGTDDGTLPERWGYITTQIIDTGEGVDPRLSKNLF